MITEISNFINNNIKSKINKENSKQYMIASVIKELDEVYDKCNYIE